MTSDDNSLALMFPTMHEKPVELGPAPAHVAELREEQRHLTTAYPTMRESRLETAGFVDDIEVPPEQARQQRAELGQLFEDIGASHEDVGYAVSAARGYRKNPPTDQQLAEMRDEAKRKLSEHFGKEAPQALADARKLATRDPRWKTLLEATHLGTDPKFVVRMAEMARRERAKGRLK